MKNVSSFQLSISRAAIKSLLFVLITSITCLNGTAQTLMPINYSSTVSYNDNQHIQDYQVPSILSGVIVMSTKGGDGGIICDVEFGDTECSSITTAGGTGAVMQAYFNIGYGPNEIQPGAIIRFIIGERGTSTPIGGGAGGGGASGILVKQPGSNVWTLLMVAGGGGGGSGIYGAEGGRSTECSGSGHCDGTIDQGQNSKAGASPWDDNSEYICSCVPPRLGWPGASYDPVNWSSTANPTGGAGGNGTNPSGVWGGFGFGGGGSGGYNGGGGGGFSGGGAYVAGSEGEDGISHGGGSFINPNFELDTFSIRQNGVNEGTGWSPQSGYATYQVSDCKLAGSIDVTTTASGCSPGVLGGAVIAPALLPGPYYYALRFEVETLAGDSVSTFETYPNTDAVFTDIFPAGTYKVTVQYGGSFSTASGVEAWLSFCETSTTFTIEDATGVGLTALCQDVTVQLDNNGAATISTNQIDNSSWTECGSLSYQLDQSSFGCADVGANTVTLTVTDSSGNTSTCSATVTVQDNIAPVALCKDVTVQLDATGYATLTGADVDNGSSDACGIVYSLTGDTSFNCNYPGTGSRLVTLTVTDPSGNSSSCTSAVTVEDNVAPVALCKDVTLNATQATNVSENIVDNGSYDACGVTVSSGPLTYTCDDLGDHVITITVTDPSGNSSTCSGTISIVDQTPPALTCPDNAIRVMDPGLCTYSVSGGELNSSVSDNCSYSVSNDFTNSNTLANALLPAGQNTITWTATDIGGNTSTCSFIVTVNDMHQPTFTNPEACPPNVTVNADPGVCTAVVTYADPQVSDFTDLCGTVVSVDRVGGLPSGSAFPVGVTQWYYTAVDDSGNGTGAHCITQVTVLDNSAPVINCQPPFEVELSHFTTYTNFGALMFYDESSYDQCSSINLNTLSLSSPNLTILFGTTVEADCDDLGPHTVTLTASDAYGNSGSCETVVTIVDQSPICQTNTVTLDVKDSNQTLTPAMVDLNAGQYVCYNDVSYSFGQTIFDCTDVGTTQTVSVTINDANGVSTNCSVDVQVIDSGIGAFACNPFPATVTVLEGGSATFDPATRVWATDNCGIASITFPQSMYTFTCADLGLQQIPATITDVNGNTGTCNIEVDVKTNYSIHCESDFTVQLDQNGQTTINISDIGNWGDPCLSDPNDAGYELKLYLWDQTINSTVEVSAGAVLDCDYLGENMFNLRLTAPWPATEGSCWTTVTVEEFMGVPVNCTENITVNADAGQCSAVVSKPSTLATVSGVCSSVTLSDNWPEDNNFPVGATTITVTATTANGNTGSCTSTVTVQDNVAPVALCQNTTVQLDASSNGSITAADIDNSSNDACGIGSIVLSQTTFDCSHIGTNTVTLTVTDNHTNVSSCTATITVQDNVAPVALCQNTTVQLDASGNGSITTADIDNGSNDACGIGSLALSQTTFDCSHVGTNTVTLTVTDNNTNVSSCTASVTVQDNVAPVALCQNATVQLDASGNGSITTSDIDNGSNDACGIGSIVLSQTTFDCSHIGTNTVTLTVTDNHTNVSSCTATVTVQDNVAPEALCQNATVQLDASGNGSITAADIDNSSNDACGIGSLVLSQTTFDCSHIGTNTVTLTVTDNHTNVSSCTATVTVEDNIAPDLSCSDVTIELSWDDEGNPTAQFFNTSIIDQVDDACGLQDLFVSSQVMDCEDIGSFVQSVTVSDINGNSNTCSATVNVVDGTAPVALCQNTTIELDDFGTASIATGDIDAGSYDYCGIQSLQLDQTAFDCAQLGANTVQLTVTDNNGNTASCNATVWVVDAIAPTAVCENVAVVLDAEGFGEITPEQIGGNSFDNCNIELMTVSQEQFDCSQAGATVAVQLEVFDQSGNSAICKSFVTITEGDVLPVEWDSEDIGTSGGSATYNPCDGLFTVQSYGYSQPTSDKQHYAYTQLCGDGEIITQVVSVTAPGWAGIQMRENNSPGSKMARLKTQLGNFVRRETRSTTNGYALNKQLFRPQATWLKLVRSGNNFQGYTSTNGSNWQFAFAATIAMNDCIEVGLFSESFTNTSLTTAVFGNVTVNEFGGGSDFMIPQTGIDVVEDITEKTIDVYPNPASGIVNLNLEAYLEQEVQLEIVDNLGRMVFQTAPERMEVAVRTLNLPELKDGTYWITVRSGNSISTKKLVIIR